MRAAPPGPGGGVVDMGINFLLRHGFFQPGDDVDKNAFPDGEGSAQPDGGGQGKAAQGFLGLVRQGYDVPGVV